MPFYIATQYYIWQKLKGIIGYQGEIFNALSVFHKRQRIQEVSINIYKKISSIEKV